MGREVLPLTVDRLGDLTGTCADCVFWELGPALTARRRRHPREDKEGWLTATLLEWGSPGRVAYVDGRFAGYITYAPAHLVPRALAFPTAPVSRRPCEMCYPGVTHSPSRSAGDRAPTSCRM